MRSYRKRRTLVVTMLVPVLLASWLTAGCQAAGGGKRSEITVAYQPGMGYAPLLIMKNQGWLDDNPQGAQVRWRRLDSGAAIRDGLIGGQIQVGAVGLSPFLIGTDKGIDWKILASLGDANFWLMAKDGKYKSLADFKDGGKIATPAPDSIHAIALRKNAQDELGDAHAVDKNLVPLGHPDGVQGLLSGQIAGHYTSPPFQFVEKQKGARKITDSRDAFGATTFAALAAQQGFYDDNREFMKALYQATVRALTMLRDDPAQAARILADESDDQTSARDYETYLAGDTLSFTATPHGLTEVGTFMHRIGLIRKDPPSPDELVFPELERRGEDS